MRSLHTSKIVAMGRRSAKIATRKGKADAQKAKLYGKIGKLIAQAVRAGGADQVANARLRDVLALAKQAQLPVDIIDRNLKKANEKNSADFSEMVYEAYGMCLSVPCTASLLAYLYVLFSPALNPPPFRFYRSGPGGTGFIIEALTDNVNRTASEVRSAVTKAGGKMADVGSVLFNFSRTGLVMVDPAEDEDATLEAALDAGASDMQPATDDDGHLEGYKVLTSLESYGAVSHSLSDQGLKLNLEESGLVYVPLAEIEVEGDEEFAANESMLERLLAVDDVDAVYTNFK